jgi:hypothetical protein
MGKMSFLLPPGLPSDLLGELKNACLVGGFDNAPVPTDVTVDRKRLTAQRAVDESGYLVVPWEVDAVGRLMVSTATLIERDEAYRLALELARGKLHHLRNHLADWRLLGFSPCAEEKERLKTIGRSFGSAVTETSADVADRHAQEVLRDSVELAERCVQHYSESLFRLRHQRSPKLDVALGCQLSALPPNPDELAAAFNSVQLSLLWRDVEPLESRYNWERADAVVDWAEANDISLTAGPLLDFSPSGLPDWLSLWEGDLSNLANFVCDYAETAISRYRGRIHRWLLATGCNLSSVLSLGEDDVLWLTARLAEAALNMAGDLELIVGVCQPWGEYLAREEHTYTPLVFLDTLLRAGLKLAGLDVELVMGVSPRGSYCRDLLEANRLLDSFAVLSTPLQLTVAFPSSPAADKKADRELSVGRGGWKAGYTPDRQAEWAGQLASLALCKPYVSGVYWAHLSDADRHRFPNCGLLDAKNAAKPALATLRRIRETHLR